MSWRERRGTVREWLRRRAGVQRVTRPRSGWRRPRPAVLFGHDGAEHVQLRGPASRPHRGEHTGQRREHDDDYEGRHGEPERLETLVRQRGDERPTEEHADEEAEHRALYRDDH